MPAPSSPATFGDLYFQPTRKIGDTEESYSDRLKETNAEVAADLEKNPPKQLSVGSFTLLTQRDAQGNYTGETRFDNEIAILGKEKESLLGDIRRYENLSKKADPADKKVYERLITEKRRLVASLSENTRQLQSAGAEHYTNAKQDKSFATTPTKLNGNGFNQALESVATIKGKEVGKEIVLKRAEQVKELQNELSELRFNAKQLLKGGLPQEIKDDLHNTASFLESALSTHTTGEIDLPSEEDLLKMRKSVRSLVDGTALEIAETKVKRSPKEAMDAIITDGNNITVPTLIQYGMVEADAKDLYELLVVQGIIQP